MTLAEAKVYLKIDYDDEDDYIQELVDVTAIYIDSCVGENYKDYDDLVSLSKLVQYKLIADLYESKSTYVEKAMQRDKIVETIFNKLANAEELVEEVVSG
jgi:uncharacterized phage protein (predicted DNA packaging)